MVGESREPDESRMGIIKFLGVGEPGLEAFTVAMTERNAGLPVDGFGKEIGRDLLLTFFRLS